MSIGREHQRAIAIGKRNVLENESSPGMRQFLGARFRLDFGGGIQDFENAFRPRQALLDAIGNVGDVGHLARELLQQPGKDDHACTDGERSLRDKPTAVRQQDDDIELGHEADRRRKDAHQPKDASLLVTDCIVASGELVDLLRLAAEPFENLRAARRLVP